jgi:hypothetical protein
VTQADLNLGIIATTLGHDTFKYAMLGPTGVNAPLTGTYPLWIVRPSRLTRRKVPSCPYTMSARLLEPLARDTRPTGSADVGLFVVVL